MLIVLMPKFLVHKVVYFNKITTSSLNGMAIFHPTLMDTLLES